MIYTITNIFTLPPPGYTGSFTAQVVGNQTYILSTNVMIDTAGNIISPAPLQTPDLDLTFDWTLLVWPNCDDTKVYEKPLHHNTIGGSIDIVQPAQHSNCESCMVVRVNVPDGTSVTVNIVKQGVAPYSGISPCVGDEMVFSDLTETITTTKSYAFGIDAVAGNENSTTFVTLSIVGGNNVSLIRYHNSILINC